MADVLIVTGLIIAALAGGGYILACGALVRPPRGSANYEP